MLLGTCRSGRRRRLGLLRDRRGCLLGKAWLGKKKGDGSGMYKGKEKGLETLGYSDRSGLKEGRMERGLTSTGVRLAAEEGPKSLVILRSDQPLNENDLAIAPISTQLSHADASSSASSTNNTVAETP